MRDSFIASVGTAEALQISGLKYAGVLKTVHRKFPFEFLSRVPVSGRFEHKTLVRRNEAVDITMAAILWVDRDHRYLVTTASDTNRVQRNTRVRWKQESNGALPVEVEFSQPNAVQIYYDVCGKIDMHNRCRQDDLNIEKKVHTQSWALRLNSTLLAMVIVDLWLLLSGTNIESYPITQKIYYELLSEQLIDNGEAGQPTMNMRTENSVQQNSIHLMRTFERRRKKWRGNVICHAIQMQRLYSENNTLLF